MTSYIRKWATRTTNEFKVKGDHKNNFNLLWSPNDNTNHFISQQFSRQIRNKTVKALPIESVQVNDNKGRIEIGGSVLMGADIPGAEPMRSAYLSLRLDSATEAERIYSLLSSGGQIFMKMEETNFASRFAMLRDKFGTSWMLLHER